MHYTVARLDENTPLPTLADGFTPENIPSPFDRLPEAAIADYAWTNAYPQTFPAFARVGWNSDGLSVLMYAKESPLLTDETTIGGMVCRDSCIEFFVNPFPNADDRYLNIETNAAGVIHVGIGDGRHGRKVYTQPIENMFISTGHSDEWWAVCYRVPAALLKENYSLSLTAENTMLGNFYKCSENIHPHFGTWNHVVSPKPDFHRPECFGQLILSK